MQCFIYRSASKDQLYLYINKKDDFTHLPEALLKSLGRLEFVMQLNLTPEQKLAREDAQKVRTQLNEKGFFIQMPPTVIANHQTIQ